MVRGQFPRAMARIFSGVVESVGAGVTRFRAGDDVLGTTPLNTSGAFAEKLITKEKLAVKKPASLSYEDAASLPIVGVTAWLALVSKGHLRAGQRVFVNGAYGGVGQAAVYIAKALGAFGGRTRWSDAPLRHKGDRCRSCPGLHEGHTG